MKIETAARKVWEAAGNRFNNAHKTWALEGDVKMMEIQTKDYLDILKIADLINSDEIKKAARKVMDLDTEVRDDIPDDVYNWLMENSR